MAVRTMKSLEIEEIDGPSHPPIQLGSKHWILSILQQAKTDDAGVSLILSGTRKDAERIAFEIARSSKHRLISSQSLKLPLLEETHLTKQLNYCMKRGVAFHHAGVPYPLRRAIEDAVRRESVRYLSSTTTLSHGVNLPFGSVILNFDSFEHLKRIQYEQYVGRARVSVVGKPVSVYAVASQPQAATLQTLLTRGLEKVVPSTLSSPVIEEANLDFLQGGRISEKLLINKVRGLLASTASSICSTSKLDVGPRIRSSLDSLSKHGFVVRKRGFVKLTREGMLLRELGLTAKECYEVQKRLASSGDWTDPIRELLSIACGVGIANEFDYVKSPTRKAQLLMAWIEETPLQDILSLTYGKPIRDADIQRLAHDTAQELRTVGQIAEHMRFHRIVTLCRSLARRLRYGVKADLGETDIIEVEHITRPVARSLYLAGFRSTFDIYDSEPDRIATSTKLPLGYIEPVCDAVGKKKDDLTWIRTYRRRKRHSCSEPLRVIATIPTKSS